MPELSRFGGMVIYMLFMDTKQHNKPHVHVYYGEYEAAIGIDGELLAGSLPYKQIKNGNGLAGISRRRGICRHGIWRCVENILIKLNLCKGGAS